MSETQLIEESENQEPEIQISIEDSQSDLNGEDELETYTKNVSKRINKLNEKNRESEQRAINAERAFIQQNAEIEQLRSIARQSQTKSLESEEEAIKTKELQIDELYKKAVQANDADAMSQASTLKNEIAIQKEKEKIATNRNAQNVAQEQNNVAQQNAYQQQIQQQPAQEPSEQALSWRDNNAWFDERKPNSFNEEAHYWARVVDELLVKEGFVPDSEEYYSELNGRISKRFPELQMGNSENVEKSGSNPSMQRVAPASRGGSRQKTSDRKGGVKFTRDEIERLRPLKPHDMSEEDWFKSIAVQKQKIEQRQAK